MATTTALPLLPWFCKFMAATATGRRLMPSGKKIRKSTQMQYLHVYKLLCEFESCLPQPLRIRLVHRSSLRELQREKNYWAVFFRKFCSFLYNEKKYFDYYCTGVFKVLKTFFNYLGTEKSLPVGHFHKKFRVPAEKFTPVIISPAQLRYLILDKEFEHLLKPSLQKIKDIFVFGCTVGLRFRDLMQLKKENIWHTPDGVFITLHTRKTGAEVKIPLPEYAVAIVNKYWKKAGRFVLPGISDGRLNIQLKLLMEKAGWTESLPKIRHRRGEPVEIKTAKGKGYRFCDHITAHTMRRTAITTLLLLGVEEQFVRRISGHAPGSREFYRYVVIAEDYLNKKVREAQKKLLEL